MKKSKKNKPCRPKQRAYNRPRIYNNLLDLSRYELVYKWRDSGGVLCLGEKSTKGTKVPRVTYLLSLLNNKNLKR